MIKCVEQHCEKPSYINERTCNRFLLVALDIVMLYKIYYRFKRYVFEDYFEDFHQQGWDEQKERKILYFFTKYDNYY